ncbi:MAG TPA: hypothetical protein VGC21_11075 [Telluria sp.]|jgi:hypothetical protein
MYEIHLTTAPVALADWPAFERHAAQLGARTLAIEQAQGEHPLQPMLALIRAGELGNVIG